MRVASPLARIQLLPYPETWKLLIRSGPWDSGVPAEHVTWSRSESGNVAGMIAHDKFIATMTER